MKDIDLTVVENLSNPLFDKIRHNLDLAITNQHKLTDQLLNLEGMSGKVYRKFINNLVGSFSNARYLETGSLKGSTVCAAMFNNACSVTCIDNWHWDWKQEFIRNTNQFRSDQIDFQLIESDFRIVNYHNIGKHNIYLFDGPHSAKEQYDGVKLALPALEDNFILIVDDWNWKEVRDGTYSAITDCGLTVAGFVEIRSLRYPEIGNQDSDWHNGYFIASIIKH